MEKQKRIAAQLRVNIQLILLNFNPVTTLFDYIPMTFY